MWLDLTAAVVAHLTHGLTLGLVTVLLLVLARFAFSATTSLRSESELVERSNVAYGIYLGGFLAGTAIALAGTLFARQTEPVLLATRNLLCEGLVIIALLRVSVWVDDRLILYGFSISREISEDRNRGTAFCVGGACVATGLVLNGALTGYSGGLLLALRDITVLWAIGQAVLVAAALAYRRLARFDIHALIQFDDNAAAGLRFGAFLVAVGVVLRGALLRAPMVAPVQDGLQTLLLAVGGLVALAVLYPVGRRVALLGRSSADEVDMHGNLAIGLVDASITLSIAVLVAAAIERVPFHGS